MVSLSSFSIQNTSRFVRILLLCEKLSWQTNRFNEEVQLYSVFLFAITTTKPLAWTFHEPPMEGRKCVLQPLLQGIRRSGTESRWYILFYQERAKMCVTKFSVEPLCLDHINSLKLQGTCCFVKFVATGFISCLDISVACLCQEVLILEYLLW